jgi:hypothetical protein
VTSEALAAMAAGDCHLKRNAKIITNVSEKSPSSIFTAKE